MSKNFVNELEKKVVFFQSLNDSGLKLQVPFKQILIKQSFSHVLIQKFFLILLT